MDANMVDPSNDLGLLVRTVLPMIVGPFVTMLAKKLMPAIPAALKPILSAVVGALSAVLGGVATGGTSAILDAGLGAGFGLAGSKARDIAVGKPAAVPANTDCGNG